MKLWKDSRTQIESRVEQLERVSESSRLYKKKALKIPRNPEKSERMPYFLLDESPKDSEESREYF